MSPCEAAVVAGIAGGRKRDDVDGVCDEGCWIEVNLS